MELTYNTLKEILMGTDILPNQIDDYEKLLEDTLRKVVQGESYLKRTINNADMKIRKKLGTVKPKKEKKSKISTTETEEEPEGPSFKDDETVSQLLNDFANWKTLLMAIEQKAGQLIFLKKKLKTSPDDAESLKKFKGLAEYLGFIE
jgi:hypothetical protein